MEREREEWLNIIISFSLFFNFYFFDQALDRHNSDVVVTFIVRIYGEREERNMLVPQ